MTKKGGQIVELGAIRGIASIMVMLAHSLILYRNPDWFQAFTYLFNGRGAVVLFFVLSGFVLTHSLAGRGIEQANVINFYIKRLFRLYPAIWACSLVSMVYLIFVHWRVASPDASDFFHLRFRTERYNWIFITASFAGMTAYVLPQIWSIFVELVASAFMPFIAFAAYRRKTLFWVSTLVALAASFIIDDRIYYLLGLYFVDFFIGASLGVLPAGILAVLKSPRLPAGPIAAVAAAGLVVSQYLPVTYYSPWAALYEATLAALLIALLVYSKLDCPALRSPLAQHLGDISYSVYLLHFVVCCSVMKGLDALQNAHIMHLQIAAKSLIVAIATVNITLPLGTLCYRYIELPGIQLGKRFGQRAKNRLNEGISLLPQASPQAE
jgi:peptidoglycan/LPS O-acetylase OafA/YrhL